jgi:hypothetical protein
MLTINLVKTNHPLQKNCDTFLIWLREEHSQEAKPQAIKARITSCLPLNESLGSLYRLLTHISFHLFSLNYNYSLLNLGYS